VIDGNPANKVFLENNCLHVMVHVCGCLPVMKRWHFLVLILRVV